MVALAAGYLKRVKGKLRLRNMVFAAGAHCTDHTIGAHGLVFKSCSQKTVRKHCGTPHQQKYRKFVVTVKLLLTNALFVHEQAVSCKNPATIIPIKCCPVWNRSG